MSIVAAHHGALLSGWTPPGDQELWWYSRDSVGVGGTLVDQSGNSLDGTGKGGAITTAGTGMITDGTGDAYSAGDVLNSVFTGANAQFSLCAWVKPDALAAGAEILLSKGNASENARQWFFFTSATGKVDFNWYTSGDGTDNIATKTTNVELTDGVWSHVVILYDGTQAAASRVTIYVDASSVAVGTITSGTPTTIRSDTAPFSAGAAMNKADTTAEIEYDGTLDDVMVFGDLLTGAEITDIYNNSPGSHA